MRHAERADADQTPVTPLRVRKAALTPCPTLPSGRAFSRIFGRPRDHAGWRTMKSRMPSIIPLDIATNELRVPTVGAV